VNDGRDDDYCALNGGFTKSVVSLGSQPIFERLILCPFLYFVSSLFISEFKVNKF
jgi:hypothetical protein